MSTTITYVLSESGMINISIYNSLGQKIRTLASGMMQPGHHSVLWDGRTDTGNNVTTGVYFASLWAGNRMTTRKMMLLK